MSTAEETRTYTPEEYLALPDHDQYELVEGQLIEVVMNPIVNWVMTQTSRLLGNHVAEHDLGWVFASENLYRCFADPSKFRRPDVSFIQRNRTTWERLQVSYLAIPPDLAIEVVSPNDVTYELGKKIKEYLAAGVRLVWVIDLSLRTINIYRANGTAAVLTERDELSGEDVIPGFRCVVAALFPPLPTA